MMSMQLKDWSRPVPAKMYSLYVRMKNMMSV